MTQFHLFVDCGTCLPPQPRCLLELSPQCPPSPRPLQVLPLFVSALPVQEDMQEASVIYACIAKLLCASHPQVCARTVVLNSTVPMLGMCPVVTGTQNCTVL